MEEIGRSREKRPIRVVSPEEIALSASVETASLELRDIVGRDVAERGSCDGALEIWTQHFDPGQSSCHLVFLFICGPSLLSEE